MFHCAQTRTSRQARTTESLKYDTMFPSRIVQNNVYSFPNFIILNLKVLACFGLLCSITHRYYSTISHLITFLFGFFSLERCAFREERVKQETLLVMQRPAGESRLVISLRYASRGYQANTIGSCMLSDSFHKLISLV